MNIIFCHYNLLPYHKARFNSIGEYFPNCYNVTSLLFKPRGGYELLCTQNNVDDRFVVENLELDNNSKKNKYVIEEKLKELNPDIVVFLGGYSAIEMRSTLRFCLLNKVRTVLCSDSFIKNHDMFVLKNFVKKKIINSFDCALVAGTPHKEYLESYDFPEDKIFLGFDVVDNEHFSTYKNEISFEGLPQKYFLTTCRFVPGKNIEFLLEAYVKYLNVMKLDPWSLVILGDGPLRDEYMSLVSDYGLSSYVFFPGFASYETLPMYYSYASAFVLPSLSETWGLVVNEAMASGLPVLISDRCGCTSDLVCEGVNGFTFDPFDIDQLVTYLSDFSSRGDDLSLMGDASREIISKWSTKTFALNLVKSFDKLVEPSFKRISFFDRIFSELMCSV